MNCQKWSPPYRSDCRFCGSVLWGGGLPKGPREPTPAVVRPKPYAKLPVLTLPRYRELLAGTRRPTREQMNAFADFVSEVHSWYKLGPFPPGKPFVFFLDPSAFEEQVVEQEGARFAFLPSTRNITLPEYRQQFGCLAYSRSDARGIPGMDLALGMFGADAHPWVVDARQHELLWLPEAVVEAGRVEITGTVHRVAANHPRLFLWRFEQAERPPYWPEESGGSDTLQEIQARCVELDRDRSAFQIHPDPRVFADKLLFELIAPERKRQLEAMVAAMQRVADLVWSRLAIVRPE